MTSFDRTTQYKVRDVGSGETIIGTITNDVIEIHVDDDGFLHNDGAPAMKMISGSESSTTIVERYCMHGDVHRVEGPAMVTLKKCSDGIYRKIRESYWMNGRRHRVGGYAIMQYDKPCYDNEEHVLCEDLCSYYLHGVRYGPEEYAKLIEIVDHHNISDILQNNDLF